jgi:hypothetical protein
MDPTYFKPALGSYQKEKRRMAALALIFDQLIGTSRRWGQKRCLRSQNRTRDLSITTDITVERDKPTTPSGVMRHEAALVSDLTDDSFEAW